MVSMAISNSYVKYQRVNKCKENIIRPTIPQSWLCHCHGRVSTGLRCWGGKVHLWRVPRIHSGGDLGESSQSYYYRHLWGFPEMCDTKIMYKMYKWKLFFSINGKSQLFFGYCSSTNHKLTIWEWFIATRVMTGGWFTKSTRFHYQTMGVLTKQPRKKKHRLVVCTIPRGLLVSG
jgi:hypothetical protein